MKKPYTLVINFPFGDPEIWHTEADSPVSAVEQYSAELKQEAEANSEPPANFEVLAVFPGILENLWN